MSEVVIVGAGGHCRSVIALLQDQGIRPVAVYDDSYRAGSAEKIMDIDVAGKIRAVTPEYPVILAVGDNGQRSAHYSTFKDQVYSDVVTHASAVVHPSASVGASNLIFGKVFVNAQVQAGDNNIFNTGCIVEHECTVGSHCHISIGAVLGGRVKIGSHCFIGAGAVVKDQVAIADHVVVGAGGVVINDLKEAGTYVGNPVRRIK